MNVFIEWLFGKPRSDKRKIVQFFRYDLRDHQDEYPLFLPGRKRVAPVLAWLRTIDIIENIENHKGVTTYLQVRTGQAFEPIGFPENAIVQSRKKGLSAVEHRVVLPRGFVLPDSLKKATEEGIPLTFIYRNPAGQCFILGEKNGLRAEPDQAGGICFFGQENDVFYRITADCLSKVLPEND